MRRKTRSLGTPEVELDPDLDRTVRKLKKALQSRLEAMAEVNQDDTPIREIDAPRFAQPPDLPALGDGQEEYELKPHMVQLLPKYRGVPGENPVKHLQEFHAVCESMKPARVSLERVKLKAFPFSLIDQAKTWIFDQEAVATNTWTKLESLFLEKYYPASKTAARRKAINGVIQGALESLSEYWERFNKLISECPHHRITKAQLIQNFYEGLCEQDQATVDAAAGGALLNKTPNEAWALLSLMANNHRQRGGSNTSIRRVHEATTTNTETDTKLSEMDKKIDSVCSMVQKLSLAVFAAQSSMQDPDEQAEVNAVGGYNNNNYQSGQNRSNYYRPNNYTGQQGPFLRDIVKKLEETTEKRFGQTEATLLNIEKQMNQMAAVLGRLDPKGYGKLPAQTMPSNTEEVKAISSIGTDELYQEQCRHPEESHTGWDDDVNYDEYGIWADYRKAEVNIPLLNKISYLPQYAKLLLEAKKNKKGLNPPYQVPIGRTSSAFIKREIPKKCLDPGVFTVPCMIGKSKSVRAMLDLGASINVMSDATYRDLRLGPLSSANCNIVLADDSVRHPKGILEDVLVQIGGLIFPADFHILDMERKVTAKTHPIILGRPFLKTSRTKIDVGAGTLSMEFGDKRVHYDITDEMKKPETVHTKLYEEYDWTLHDSKAKEQETKQEIQKEVDDLRSYITEISTKTKAACETLEVRLNKVRKAVGRLEDRLNKLIHCLKESHCSSPSPGPKMPESSNNNPASELEPP